METIAIIGTGISGLGCAHFLQHRYQLTLYEKAGYVGGHTNTVRVPGEPAPVPIDTGFMTYNEVTYPNLTRLFHELDVVTRPSSMSFSVQHLPARLEFCGSSLNHLFGQRRNLLKPPFWRMLLQVNRFNQEAAATIEASARPASSGDRAVSLGDYVRERNYGDHFLNYYLLPMSCAVWSTPPDRMLQFPAMTLLRFFYNHGFLGLHTQHPWRTVVGGACCYVDKLTAPFRDRIHLRRGAVTVRRGPKRVAVTDQAGYTLHYDHVILACHADQALALLPDADIEERAVLSQFRYQPNTALLHTDARVMPRTERCWSSWNYRIDYDEHERVAPSTVYWINRLQGIGTRRNYFVSINGEDTLAPDSVLERIRYEHPLFNDAAIEAQARLPQLNQRRTGVYLCGSYFRYGFHEDALTSALQLSRLLAGDAWH
ncbi:MAG: NAD(P)/FAD-dependent oxidoreductase [Steroidobacteraceae bacterium]